ncbi:MAG TPA: diaminopimelate decarboxylase, partial [Candidatus Bacteroides merdavium]|nr:diaminopimelate decarboxylase [Candidatus Bacteroides merdavium]
MQNIEYKNATELNTPFFLFDVDHLTDQVRLIKKAFERYWNNALIAYSVKTNSLPFLSKVLLNQNIAAEVVSEDEFNLVNKVGFYGSDIVCNG